MLILNRLFCYKSISMSPKPFSIPMLNPRDVIESITLKKIMLEYPDAITYKSLIRFTHLGKTARLDLTLLPLELANKIDAMFA